MKYCIVLGVILKLLVFSFSTRMLWIKSMWPLQTFGIHPKDFLAISEIFENFHIELASQPMLS